jgi:hypothetical protein
MSLLPVGLLVVLLATTAQTGAKAGAAAPSSSARAGVVTTRTPIEPAEQPLEVFVSTSGVPHWDIADVPPVRSGLGWDPGDPDSVTPEWTAALNTVVAGIAAEGPTAVFHTGDQVHGRWGIDVDHTGIFGPVGTDAQKKAAVRAAAALYYGAMKQLWAAYGFTNTVNFFPAVGDHEIGDIGRRGLTPTTTFRYRAYTTWLNAWARAFTASGLAYASRPREAQQASTAYAVRLGPVLLVTVNPMWRLADGVHVRIGGRQLRWLDRRIAQGRANGVTYVIVQSEIPVLGPNRDVASSRLLIEGGRQSAFWKTLVRNHVDLLLAGEFHALTTHSNGGTTPVQVVHGTFLGRTQPNYLVIRVYRDRLELTLKQMAFVVTDPAPLWQTSSARPPSGLIVDTTTTTVGTMTIDKTTSPPTLRHRTGYFREGIR